MDRRQLSRHLRALARVEISAEREADEAAVRTYHDRSRSLVDAVVELTPVTSQATAYLADVPFTGSLVHAAGDLVTLRREDGTEAHVKLSGEVVLRVETGARGAHLLESSGPQAFIARIRQLELESRYVRIVTTSGNPHIEGTARVVAADHVVVATGDAMWLVPTSSIAAIVTDPDGATG